MTLIWLTVAFLAGVATCYWWATIKTWWLEMAWPWLRSKLPSSMGGR